MAESPLPPPPLKGNHRPLDHLIVLYIGPLVERPNILFSSRILHVLPLFLPCIQFRGIGDPRTAFQLFSRAARKVRREPPTVFARGVDVSLFGEKARAILKLCIDASSRANDFSPGIQRYTHVHARETNRDFSNFGNLLV